LSGSGRGASESLPTIATYLEPVAKVSSDGDEYSAEIRGVESRFGKPSTRCVSLIVENDAVSTLEKVAGLLASGDERARYLWLRSSRVIRDYHGDEFFMLFFDTLTSELESLHNRVGCRVVVVVDDVSALASASGDPERVASCLSRIARLGVCVLASMDATYRLQASRVFVETFSAVVCRSDGHAFNKVDKRISRIFDRYEVLRLYTKPIRHASHDIIGRDREIRAILSTFCRPELCNVILVAPAGVGKTAIVQALMARDTRRVYLEVDLALMVADLPDSNQMAARLKKAFDAVVEANEVFDCEIVLFIDEFHQVVQLSAAAVEALKPLLADSGTRGIRIVAATTESEFLEFVAPNQPLVERLQRVMLNETDAKTTVAILRGFAQRHHFSYLFNNDRVFDLIVEYTNRYMPAESQPRKSIVVLDAMLGHYGFDHTVQVDEHLLSTVLAERGIHTNLEVDVAQARSFLSSRVIAQDWAVSEIEKRLYVCAANLNNHKRPMATFLFVGSTGVGKTEMAKQLANFMFGSVEECVRFDMTSYNEASKATLFQERITDVIRLHPNSVVLLDEVEKAHRDVITGMLPMLDDARLENRQGKETTFKNCIICMTTNAGAAAFQRIGMYSSSDTGAKEDIVEFEDVIEDELRSDHFPPEFLGRFDAIVPFTPLTDATREKIVSMKIEATCERLLRQSNVSLVVSPASKDKKRQVSDVIRYLVSEGVVNDTDKGGARATVRRYEDEFVAQVARYVCTHPNARRIAVRVDGEMAIDNKLSAKGTARLVVFELKSRGY
jgi:ATP-dependent Clp protease ATP-binding subunit ClpC